jgi:hypothetical protein
LSDAIEKNTSDDRGLVHLFELSGLGTAPFRFSALTKNEKGCSCDYCGHFIKNECWIIDSQGNRFKVGTDCVAKTGDAGLISKLSLEKPRQRAEKKRSEIKAHVEKIHQAERQRNGGKTNYEMFTELSATVKSLASTTREEIVQKSSQYIDLLKAADTGGSPFVSDMIRIMEAGDVLSERASRIVLEICAKEHSGKRKNSADYQASYAALAPGLAERNLQVSKLEALIEDKNV